MHTNVILTNKKRIHTQPNYNNTKLKAWFRRLLRHPARKRPVHQYNLDPHGGKHLISDNNFLDNNFLRRTELDITNT